MNLLYCHFFLISVATSTLGGIFQAVILATKLLKLSNSVLLCTLY